MANVPITAFMRFDNGALCAEHSDLYTYGLRELPLEFTIDTDPPTKAWYCTTEKDGEGDVLYWVFITRDINGKHHRVTIYND